MKGRIWKVKAAALAAALAVSTPVLADEWDLSEDGKYWMYFDYSGEPLQDEWIEVEGKIYYLDAKGYMKTGWVTNREDGNKYYMGEDGAMVTSAFTPDGQYVGPDGVIVKRYDTYRKKVKAEVKKAAKNTGSRKKAGKSGKKSGGAEPATVKQSYFLLADLNQDGYRDLVIMDREVAIDSETGNPQLFQPDQVTAGSLVEIAVWDPEGEEFLLSAEFDESEGKERSTLYQSQQGQGVWLEIAEDEENFRLFRLGVDTSNFEGMWSFSTRLDDWGGLEYLQGQDVLEQEAWNRAVAQAKQERGNVQVRGYLPVSDENLSALVDLELTEEDLRMWQ